MKAKKPARRPRDPNQLAKLIVDMATGEAPRDDLAPRDDGKNPAAVALGRLGGLKGGKARAASLSARKRREIAKKAASARWRKRGEK
ncbi:MAG: histone H1 [bacterium]|nr:histone H1 [bacterium]